MPEILRGVIPSREDGDGSHAAPLSVSRRGGSLAALGMTHGAGCPYEIAIKKSSRRATILGSSSTEGTCQTPSIESPRGPHLPARSPPATAPRPARRG